MKVVRTSSDILALIKSCDNANTKDEQKVVKPAIDHSITNNCITSLIDIPQNVQKKTLRPLGPKRIFKPNIKIVSKVEQEVTNIDTQSLNSSGSKKLVSLIQYYQC